MKEKFRQFMTGRYGMDDLGRVLNIAVLILLIISLFTGSLILLVAVALMVYTYFRMLSRNVNKRAAENYAFLRLKNRFLGWFRERKNRFKQRKEYRFYKCPSCSQVMRVPKGKGKITITCPKCGNRITRKY